MCAQDLKSSKDFLIAENPDNTIPSQYEGCVSGAYKSILAAIDQPGAQEIHQELLAVFLTRLKTVIYFLLRCPVYTSMSYHPHMSLHPTFFLYINRPLHALDVT
jgi:hypothetical protein